MYQLWPQTIVTYDILFGGMHPVIRFLWLQTVTSWREYVLNKRRKKRREMDTLEKRRVRLLQLGATKWLTVAADLSDLRAKFAAQRQAKVKVF